MGDELTIRPLTPETWDAFAGLVERHSSLLDPRCEAAHRPVHGVTTVATLA